MKDLLTCLFLAVGGAFMFLAALGLIRMPDVFLKLQATTKASTLGAGSLLIAVATYFSEVDVTARSMLVLVFVFMTAPVGAHAIARAAHMATGFLWSGTVRDDLTEDRKSGKYVLPKKEDLPKSD